MRSYGQYCPISIAADVLGDRWTLLIMREVIGGATRFNELERLLPKISRSLLSQRLRQLERVGLIHTEPLAGGRGKEYRPTVAGEEVMPVLMAMGEWSVRWFFGDPTPEQLDSQFVMWWMHRRVNQDVLPPGRTVARFDFVGGKREVFWLVLQPDEVSLCQKDPGFDVDVSLTADRAAFHRVFAGRLDWRDALADESVTINGPSALVRAFPSWFAWSPFHDVTLEQAKAQV